MDGMNDSSGLPAGYTIVNPATSAPSGQTQQASADPGLPAGYHLVGDGTTGVPPPQAPAPTGFTAFLKRQLGGQGQDYGSGLGYLVDNPVTRAMGGAANELGTGVAELAQKSAGFVSPDAAAWLKRNVTQPLAARQADFDAAKNSGVGSDVVYGLSNLGTQLAFAGATAGAAGAAEAPVAAEEATGLAGKLAPYLSRPALMGAAPLGFAQAGAQAAQQEGQGKTPSGLGILGHGVANTVANLVPLGSKGSVLKRMAQGALVSEGMNEGQNLLNGNPLGTGALMATGLGAGFGLLPHAPPGSLSEAANTIHETKAGAAEAAAASEPADTAAAAGTTPATTVQPTSAPRVDPGLPPWADPDTGEMASPKKPELVSAMADHMLGQRQASGDIRIDPDQIARAWGVPLAQVKGARKEAEKLAMDRLAQAERAAMAPPQAAPAGTATDEQGGGPRSFDDIAADIDQTHAAAAQRLDAAAGAPAMASDAVPEARKPGAPLHAWTPIDDSVSVPYAGGVSDDGRTVYLDKRMPASVDVGGTPVDARQAVALHERTEWPLMHLTGPMDGAALDDLAQRVGLKSADELPQGVRDDLAAGKNLDYAQAHDLATQAENQFVRTTYGVDPDKYQAALTDAIDAARKQAPGSPDVPHNLDAKPYVNEGEAPLAKGIEPTPDEEATHGTETQAPTAGVPAPASPDERGAPTDAQPAAADQSRAAAGAEPARPAEPSPAREAEPAGAAEQPSAPQPEPAGAASGADLSRGIRQPSRSLPAEPKLPAAPYDLTPEQVHAHAEAVKNYGDRVEESILGNQVGAWRKALRQRDSSNDETSRKGEAELARIEGQLSPAEQDALYGVGGNPEAFDDLADYRRSHSDAMVTSPAEAGEAMARFLSKLGGTEGRDPSAWPREAQVAYAGMRTLRERIAQEGWDSKAIQKRALQVAASRYDDANDAEMMLRRFLPQEPQPKAMPRNPDEPKTIAHESAKPGGEGITFKTAKGSTYEVHADGTTSRDKAFRPEHGAKEKGPQPRSEQTFYVSPEDADKLGGEFQAQGGPQAAIVTDGKQHAGLRYLEGKDANKIERRTVVPVSYEPQVGMVPVELWRNGTRAHFGNVITEVTESGADLGHRRGAKGTEATAVAGSAPTTKESPTVGQQRTRELLGAKEGDTIRTTGMGKEIQPGSTWKIERIDADGTVHISSPGGGTGSFKRSELTREVRAGATFEKVNPAKAAAAAGVRPSAAARDAEGMRIKTTDGEMNGRVHVDRLIRAGYTRVESTRAGDRMVHSLVNATGAHEPIKARQLKYAKEEAAKQVEQPPEVAKEGGKPAPAEATGKPAQGGADKSSTPRGPAKEANTEDAGQELWANRRNSTGKGIGWSDVEGLNDTLKAREAVKAKVWPRPDYEKLVEEGLPAPVAHLIKQVYDAVGAKPHTASAPTDAQYKAYIEGVHRVREAVFDWTHALTDGSATDVFKRLHMLESSGATGEGHRLRTMMLDAMFPLESGRSRFTGNDAQAKANNTLAHLLGGNKLLRALQPQRQELVTAQKALKAGWPKAQEAWQRKGLKVVPLENGHVIEGTATNRAGEQRRVYVGAFDGHIRLPVRDSSDAAKADLEAAGRYGLLDKRNQLLSTHASEAEAIEAARASQGSAGGDGAKTELPVKLAEGARQGAPRRAANEDITSDRLLEAFGFKGVNFGNWMKGEGTKAAAERQAHLNHAYDAFQDLADIMHLPPRALGLDGTLGLAVGAQGRGGKQAAAAHFVPGVNEINLTRDSGAGSLAHEWAHALDHYFATLAGGKVVTGGKPFLTEHLDHPVAGVRPEVRKAFDTIVEAMRKRPETDAERADRLAAYQRDMRTTLDRELSRLRQSVEAGDRGGDKAAVLAQFDELAKTLRTGDLGEGYVSVGKGKLDAAAQHVGQLLNLAKEATGRRVDDWQRLNMAARLVSRLADTRDAAAEQRQSVSSEYLKEARLLEGTRKTPYWSTNLELFARAFQSYVLDKLATEGGFNHYLTRPQLPGETVQKLKGTPLGEAGDRYPRGAERTAINKAFDTLVGVLKTETREDGRVRLFRQGGGQGAADRSPAQEAHTAKIKALTDELTHHWQGDDLPSVKVVNSPEQFPEAAKVDPRTGAPDASYQRARGMYDGKNIWIAANKHADTPEGRAQLARSIAHEAVGHFGVERIVTRELGVEAWRKIETATERLRADPSQATPRMAAVVKDVETRYRRENGAASDPATFAKELLAVTAERGIRNGLLDRAVAAVRAFVRRMLPDLKLNEADLRRLLSKSDEYLQRGETPRERVQSRAALAFSRDGWSEDFPNAVTAHQPGFVREHADYAAAKAGDDAAALRLARDAVTPEFVAKVKRSLPDDAHDVVVVPVQAREGAGDNRIPTMAAEVLAEKLGATTDNRIMQAEKVSRGGADAMHRLANQPTFTGKVERGRDYVLLDDTLTQGGTLAQLKTHIEREGGRVALATALTGKDYSRKLALDPDTLGKVRERFGRIEGWWRRRFGYDFNGLTESEARTLLTYDKGRLSPDQLRDRILTHRLPELGSLGEGATGARPGAEASGRAGDAVEPESADQRQQDTPGGVAVTDSPAFKRFFSDSKVVDANGAPLPVFHGTADDFNVFGHERSGEATGHATSPLGHFFTPDRAQAEGYARNASDGRPADERVVDAYLRIEKPYTMSLEQAQRIETPGMARAVRAQLEAKGYDGIHLPEQNAWVAFHPEQIKSASDNRGTFDRNNPNIYFDKAANVDDSGKPDRPGERRPFSHATDSIEAMHEHLPKLDEGVFQKAKDWLHGKWLDMEPKLLGALQLRHVLELAKDIPELKKGSTAYADKFQAMDADRNQMQVKGAAQVKDLTDWAYEKGLVGWRGKLKPEAKALFKFQHEVTQLGVDPTNTYEKLLMRDSHGDMVPWTKELIKERVGVIREQMRGRAGDDKTKMMDQIKELQRLPARENARAEKYPELLAKWNALTPRAKEMFVMQRDHYREQAEQLELARNDQIEALDLPRQEKMALQKLNADMFEQMRSEGVYFPLQRFGDFWIAAQSPDVLDKDGNVSRAGDYTFTKYETAKQAMDAEKRMRAAGYEIYSRGRQVKDFDSQKPVTGTFMAEVQDLLRKSGAPDKVRDAVNQMYLKTLPELSLRKRGIHRYNVAGYTDNVPRVFASSVLHGAHQIAKARYGWQLGNTLDHLKETLEAKRVHMDVAAAAHADALLGELDKRHSWVLNPTSNKLVTMMNAIGFTYYLSASPASAAVNLAQTPMITLPVLAAQHGWDKAGKVLSATMKDAIRTGGDLRRALKTDEERQAFDTLQAAGTFTRTATHTLGGVADDNALQMHPAWGKVLGAMGYLFQKAEVVNRTSAGMAAFRLARAEGKSVQEAIKHADEIVNGTHFDYSNANRSRWMQGSVGKVLGQFKSYSVGMTWLYYRSLYKAMKGETPEVRALARRTLTGVLGMTGLFAGFMGTPISNLVSAAANAYNAAFGDDNKPWDFATEFHSWLAEHLGTTAADAIAYGPVSQVTGADVSHRLSASDMWFRDTDQNLTGEKAYDAFLESMAGPIGGIARNLFVGAQQFNTGHTERGIETMMPTALKNVMKGMRYATQGVDTLNGAPIVDDVSGPESLIQAMGFQPTKVAEQQRVNSALRNAQAFVTTRRTGLMNAYAMAVVHGDGEAQSEALAKIRDFNQAWPQYPISMSSLRDSLRTSARNIAEAQGGVRINRRLDATLRDQVMPAATGAE